jgi:hypothetical protein
MRTDMTAKVRNVVCVLLGVAVFMLKRHYSGPFDEMVHGYAGNISVSFALYFVAVNLPLRSTYKRLLTAGLVLAAVELFEALDGFGVMTNTYDPFDFLANAVGIAFAWAVDTMLEPDNTSA